MTSPPLKILFLHAGAEMYGSDRILLELLKGLPRDEFRPMAVLPQEGPLAPALRSLDVPVDIMELGVLRRRYFTPWGAVDRLSHLLSAAGRLTRLIRERGIDIVHTNTSAVLAGAVAARRAGVPHVWHIHEITTRPALYGHLMARFILRRATAVVAVSAAVRDHLAQASPLAEERILVIHNGIDPEPFMEISPHPVRHEYGIAPGTVFAGMVGRVNWWKGQDAFLDAAHRILARRDDIRFVLVGGTFEGQESLMDILRQRIRDEGLEAKVFLSGYREDIPDVLAALDIMVLPSTEPDPLPSVVLEAMAAGKPVISFAHGGSLEMVVDGRTGILVPVGDVVALGRAIERLADDPELRAAMGQAGRDRCLTEFSLDAFLKNFRELYTRLAHR